jgi:AraC-like DNA-binding protein
VLKHHHKVASGLSRGILETCKQRNIAMDDALLASELTVADLNAKHSSMSAVKFSQLLTNLSSATADTTFGMKCAGNFRLGDSGPFGLGMMNAPSFGHAIRFYVRYLPLVADHAMFVADLGDDTVLLQWKYSPFLLERCQYVDFCIYLTLRQFRLFAGQDWSPRAIHLVRDKSDQTKHLYGEFAANIIFGAEANAMEIAGCVLKHQNLGADTRLFEHMERLCETELEKKNRLTSLEFAVSEIIVNGLADKPVTLQEVAKRLNIEGRNLQRRLSVRGTSFEKLVQCAKQELSLTLLKDTDLLIEQIAYRVGYESPNAYSRANHIWFGESPSVTRSKLLSGDFQIAA